MQHYLMKHFTPGYYFFLPGFIMMTPQLFINYKLKSVAHLPWRMLTYKALNTFVCVIYLLYLNVLYLNV